MMEFSWELQNVLQGLKRTLLQPQVNKFLRPHSAIWSESPTEFTLLADEIMTLLPDEQVRLLFLSTCLGSYLLNYEKAPKTVPNWIQSKIAISELLGIDVPLDELLLWRWDRAAFPVLDAYDNRNNDTIYYALVADSKSDNHPLLPSWANDVMNADALDAVRIAADFAKKQYTESCFFFWPFINPKKPTHDRSLGLSTYLSFLSLAECMEVPLAIATGELDRKGCLHPVHGVLDKFNKASDKGYKLFIYPEDGLRLQKRPECTPVGVWCINEAEKEWGVTTQAARLSSLKELLVPLAYEEDLNRHTTTSFMSRDWLDSEITSWLNTQNGSKVFMLVGPPGFGKSAFVAWLCSNHPDVAAWHFCAHYSDERKNAATMVRSLSFQLAHHCPQYATLLYQDAVKSSDKKLNRTDEYVLFEELLKKPLEKLVSSGWQPNKSMLLVIDALDEAAKGDTNSIARLLSRRAKELPPWIRLVATTRSADNGPLFGSEVYPYILDTTNLQNLRDIQKYLFSALPTQSDELRRKVAENSAGLFLYAVSVAKAIRKGRYSEDNLPSDMNGFYLDQFERLDQQILPDCGLNYRSDIRPLLCLVTAAYKPLSREVIQSVLGLNRMVLSDRLKVLSDYFPSTGTCDKDTIAPFHRSISEWISDSKKAGKFFIDTEEGHKLFSDYGFSRYSNNMEELHDYLLTWLPSHLLDANRTADRIELLKDFPMMMLRAKRGCSENMPRDYQVNNQDEIKTERIFFVEYGHLLRGTTSKWPAHKVLLQLAVEHADNSPLTKGAEKYLQDGKCDWLWLRKVQRPPEIVPALYKSVFSGHTANVLGALELRDGRIVSWSDDSEFCIWKQDGSLLKKINYRCLPFSEEHIYVTEMSDGLLLFGEGEETEYYRCDINNESITPCIATVNEEFIKQKDLNFDYFGHVWPEPCSIQLKTGDFLCWKTIGRDYKLYLRTSKLKFDDFECDDTHYYGTRVIINDEYGYVTYSSEPMCDNRISIWDKNSNLIASVFSDIDVDYVVYVNNKLTVIDDTNSTFNIDKPIANIYILSELLANSGTIELHNPSYELYCKYSADGKQIELIDGQDIQLINRNNDIEPRYSSWAGELIILVDFIENAWFSNLSFKVQDVLEDGRVLITEEDGNLSFLQLYVGNQKVSRHDAHEILKSTQKGNI